MEYENVLRLLLVCASLCLGAYLTAIRSKITSVRTKNSFHWGIYIICALINFGALTTFFIYKNNIFGEKGEFEIDWFAFVVIILCIVFSLLLIIFTHKNLVGKYHYKTHELAPLINKFTSDADKNNIKLLAGDINFFGNYPREMDKNIQYKCLKEEKFRQIHILCFEPNTNEEKIRYGKILCDFQGLELKYYKPTNADLSIRGRIKTLNGAIKLLIYNKIESGTYEAIETDTANSSGALYDHIWDLIWELAEAPTDEKIDEYKKLFKN